MNTKGLFSMEGNFECPTTIRPAVEGFDNSTCTAVCLAREHVARAYWGPLFVFARRLGRNHHQAEDDVQSFFLHLLTAKKLRRADLERGRFRTFLLFIFKNFVRDKWRSEKWHRLTDSLDFFLTQNPNAEPGDAWTPEEEYFRNWARVLLTRAHESLRLEEVPKGNGDLFADVCDRLDDLEAMPYAELSKKYDAPEGTLRQHVSRLKKRFHRLILEEVQRTLDAEHRSTEAVREELARVFGHLRNRPRDGARSAR